MDLWIRSQNRENTVKIINQYGLKFNDKKTIIANFQPDFTDKYDGYYEVLGTYKTKERALEVLDEIQEYLCFDKFNYEDKDRTCYQDCGCYKSDIVMVYEMPKE